MRFSSGFTRWLALTLLAVTLGNISAQPARNIILFIGDGMGFEQVLAARCYNGGPLSFEVPQNFPYTADCATYSADNAITDSAASGTAIATGVKVNNGVISLAVPGDGLELETLLEFYQKQTKKVGLITTAYLTHATPAVFAAHETSRNNYSQIGQDYLTQTLPHILFGGGGNGLDPTSTANAGYLVVTETAEFNALSTTLDYLSAQFGNAYMPYEEDYLGGGYPYPHLTDMTLKALASFESHPDGFFLMIEGARIDHACHDNRLPEAVHETIELSRAVQAALDWAYGRTDTTILVTADHETGGLTVTGDNGSGNYPSVTWSSGDHTAANVPVYAWGVNASLVSGTLDNTDFFNLLTAENSSSPVLARVSATVLSETSVRITWLTDVAASSTVEFGLASGSYGTPVTDAALVTDHAVLLEGLLPDEPHYFRVTSTTAASVSATSAEYTFTPTSQLVPGTLIATGAAWKYHDDGIDLGTAWREPGYVEDGTWAEGSAPLGYGSTYAIGTVISYGPNSSSKYPCYYFRREITVTDPAALGDLSLRMHRDDGAVVYLNGTEIARYNMPSGTISYSTWASTASDYDWDPARPIPNTLVAGLNLLAVEVHQANAGSSDLVMDLELTAALLEPDTTPPLVSGVAVTALTDRSGTVTWTTDEPADSQVDYGVTEDLEFRTGSAALVTEHSVQLTGLNASTSYRYVASSMDPFGNAGYGPDLSFTTLERIEHPPSAPANMVAIPGPQSVKLTWSASTDPDGDVLVYDVFCRLDGEVHDTYPLARVTGTTFTDTGLTDQTVYYYVVRCVDETGRFANSMEVWAKPDANAYDAYVIQNPTVNPGAYAGDYTATKVTGDGANQALTGTSVDPNK